MNRPISNPILPPLDGYVEIEINGIRQYQAIYPSNTAIQTLVYDTVADEYIKLPLPIETIRAIKTAEISAATEQTIKSGVDVTTAYGPEHFGLDDHDQINISNLSILLGTGVTGYLYHADGKLCVLYSAADLQNIVGAAMQWVTYHTTYNNFVKAWINRETDAEVIQSIIFGNALPDDLQTEMDSLFALVGGGSS